MQKRNALSDLSSSGERISCLAQLKARPHQTLLRDWAQVHQEEHQRHCRLEQVYHDQRDEGCRSVLADLSRASEWEDHHHLEAHLSDFRPRRKVGSLEEHRRRVSLDVAPRLEDHHRGSEDRRLDLEDRPVDHLLGLAGHLGRGEAFLRQALVVAR